jgi:hypothetical protein
MSNIKDGGPAFPGEKDFVAGMTLRDYFAAKAMQAFISSYPMGSVSNPIPDVAADAYDMADAMLAAREEA